VPISVDNAITSLEKQEEINLIAWEAIFEIIGAGTTHPKSKSEGSYKSIIDIITGK